MEKALHAVLWCLGLFLTHLDCLAKASLSLFQHSPVQMTLVVAKMAATGSTMWTTHPRMVVRSCCAGSVLYEKYIVI